MVTVFDFTNKILSPIVTNFPLKTANQNKITDRKTAKRIAADTHRYK
jgi:hypothetical protein